jgi:ribosomal protein S18 acetylase RimI-like enzyme
MAKLDVAQWGPERLRVAPWRGDPSVAQLTPSPGHLPTPATLDRCLDALAGRGYRSVLTAALTEQEQRPFREAGFVEHERLHLLRHNLMSVPNVSLRPNSRSAGSRSNRAPRLRRGRRSDRATVLEVDGVAFDPFWRFDAAGLDDARAATPNSRFRVADSHGEVVGYAITGRAGLLGYLQRLAVRPDRQGEGLGRALVVDALRWARRHGASSMLVNTQETNARALALYRKLGFVQETVGLAVLERPVDDGIEERG